MSVSQTGKRKLTVYIGRFGPAHLGHCEVLRRALLRSEKVLVIVGSYKQPRTPKNPWTGEERGEMLQHWYEDNFHPDMGKLIIDYSRNWRYNNTQWLENIQATIRRVEPSNEVWITGSDRDKTTFYLNELGASYKLDLVEENRDVSKFLTATVIREMYFGRTYNGKPISETEFDTLLKAFLPHTTREYLSNWRNTSAFQLVKDEYDTMVDRYKQLHCLKYPIMPVTVDSVVIQSGHILLIRRKDTPGRGLWALPGGHLNEDEWMFDGAVRELREETRLKVPEPVLRGSLRFDQIFEAPDRSQFGRVITRAFCFVLPDARPDGKVELPPVYGDDDADKARWFTLGEVKNMSDQMFDDHHDIVEICIDRLAVETARRPVYQAA